MKLRLALSLNEMESITRVQVMDEAVCISLRTNTMHFAKLSKNSRTDWVFGLRKATSLGEGKFWIQTV